MSFPDKPPAGSIRILKIADGAVGARYRHLELLLVEIDELEEEALEVSPVGTHEARPSKSAPSNGNLFLTMRKVSYQHTWALDRHFQDNCFKKAPAWG